MLATIASCRSQLYPNWNLRLCLDRSTPSPLRELLLAIAQQDDRVHVVEARQGVNISDELNAALAAAAGEFIVLLYGADVLSEYSLYWIAREIVAHPEAGLIFSDEDRIDSDGRRLDPRFKSDWNSALMLSCNAVGQISVFRKSLVNEVGGFRPQFAGQFDYDLVLRCAAATTPERIRHIPRILYHRGVREADAVFPDVADAAAASAAICSTWECGRKAIEQHLAESGARASVRRANIRRASVSGGHRQGYQVDYALPVRPIQVSILLPSRCESRLIEPCLNSLLTQTTYAHYEVLLLVEEQDRSTADDIRASIQFANSSRVRVLAYSHQPFSFSWINNWAASQADGEFLCFLNDDTTVITPDWLERLLARACQPGVAAAGPMLRYPDGSIQQAGVILGLGGVAGHACHGLPAGDCGYLDRACLEQDVSCLSAACLVMRSTVFQNLGGFDEALPVAYNDVDLCLRLRKAGWRLIWTPTVELFHHESASTGRHDAPHRRHEFRSAVALMRERWGTALDRDPYYNPNLSLRNAYHLAFPPRNPGP
jgi:GT2 family glycosyltransferase